MTVALEDLRRVDLFDDLDDEQLAAWLPVLEERELEDGTVVLEQGEPVEGFILLLDGTMRTFHVDGARAEPLHAHVAPTWIGAIPVLTENPIAVRMVCAGPCRIALVRPDAFYALVVAQEPIHRRILRQFTPVLSRIAELDQRRERLAGLGTMAAGLAHELNNPAAAAKRAAADLAEAIDVVSSVIARFVESGVEREDAARLVDLQRQLLDRAATQGPLDALDAAEAEEAVLERLEDLGVAEPWRLAEPLAAAGADDAWLQEVADRAGPAAAAAVEWVAATLSARTLAEELRSSAERMSDLVGAIKRYAYMDQGELNEVDVHEGLETTLAVLGHKLKHGSVQVRRDYDRDLPKATVHGGELNQVWTNLLDNAIHALDGSGTITLRTRRDGGCALVEVADDGPGIPEEARSRVFEPFFTTKEVGEGTGLGLDTARRIVVDRHGGSITFDSSPEGTTFRVWIPLGA